MGSAIAQSVRIRKYFNIHISKFYIRNTDQNVLLKSVERLIRSATEKTTLSSNWKGDSAADIVGICESDVNDGSVDHDRYIYGSE